MTDDRRLDLRILDAGDEPGSTGVLVRAVMDEIRRRPRDDHGRELHRYRIAVAVAAAVFATIALATMRARPGDSSAAADIIVEWALDGHVPTNGELLATYQGYRP